MSWNSETHIELATQFAPYQELLLLAAPALGGEVAVMALAFLS